MPQKTARIYIDADSFDWGSASKLDDVTALPSRHKMADMCYYGNVMTTTRWWLCVTMGTL